MLILIESIYQVWKDGKIFSAVLMDITRVFNNVHHTRLIHNMRKRKIPTEIIQWILLFLNNRTTRMRFNGIIIEFISITIDISQELSLSPILYVLYNSDLLEISKKRK